MYNVAMREGRKSDWYRCDDFVACTVVYALIISSTRVSCIGRPNSTICHASYSTPSFHCWIRPIMERRTAGGHTMEGIPRPKSRKKKEKDKDSSLKMNTN